MAYAKNTKKTTRVQRGRRAWAQGLYAEKLAMWVLRLKGYKILNTRLKTPVGEIDILCQKGQTLVVVEVKYRPTHTQALEAVGPRQMHRLSKAVEWALYKKTTRAKYANMKIRFDVFLVIPYKLPKHIKNIWMTN